jgi:hypothetical protein
LFLIFGLDAAIEEASCRQEFGVEEGGSRSSTNQIVREQSEFDVEEGAFADAADYGGHAVTSLNVAAWLRAIVLIENDHGITDG